MNLEYELKTEEFEEDGETITFRVVEVTAKTDKPSTKIIFEKSSKPLAETITDGDGKAVVGFNAPNRKCAVKVTCDDETEQITIPNLN